MEVKGKKNSNLNSVIFEQWMIESRLLVDINTIYDIPIFTLQIQQDMKINPLHTS